MSVVLFSYHSELKIKFSDFTNIDDFKAAVSALPLMKSTTRIDKALNTAFSEMFNEKNGMRVNVPKVLVLLTDGEQTKDPDAVPPSRVVQKFHDAGIKVVVIGIGRSVNPTELRSLVRAERDLYLAKDFDQLKSDDFVDSITSTTCVITCKYFYQLPSYQVIQKLPSLRLFVKWLMFGAHNDTILFS